MVVGAIGIEIANVYYETHSNLKFGLFCNVVQVVFFLCVGLALYFRKKQIV